MILVYRLLVPALAMACSGCVASNFQKAPVNTPPAVTLNLSGKPTAPVRAEVETVIAYNGPGSWKRRAFWDEYVVAIANEGGTPVRIAKVSLLDQSGQRLAPGSDWEDLERQSADWWKRLATPENFLIGAGTTVSGVTAGSGLGLLYLALMAGSAPVAGIGAGVALVGAGAMYLLGHPSDAGRQAITAEFDRRRFVDGKTLIPGEVAAGSFFFRITPAPRELIVDYERAGRMHTVTIDLAVLNALHMKPQAGVTLAPVASTAGP